MKSDNTKRIQVVTGDITRLAVDAIVNAANVSLSGGGGVDGAIHRAAGPALAQACAVIRRKRGGCPVGEAVKTPAGDLPAGAVIHTVGPVWHGGDSGEPAQLRRAYLSCLAIAAADRMASLAFPNISTGIYGFPKERAAEIALDAVSGFLKDNPWPQKVIFVCFDNQNAQLYQAKLC